MAVIEIYFVTTMASRHHLLSSVFPVPGGTSHTSTVLKLLIKKERKDAHFHEIADKLFRLQPIF